MIGSSGPGTGRLLAGRPSSRRIGPAVGLLAASLVLLAGCGSVVPPKHPRSTLPVRVVDFPSETVLTLSHQGPASEMLPVLHRLVAYMRAKEIRPQGDFMVVFHSDPLSADGGEASYDVAVPVAEGTKVEAPYRVQTIPERTTAAVELLHCPFVELAPHYQALYRWAKRHGYVPDGEVMDVFRVKPGTGVAREKLRTEVHLPVTPAD